MLIAERLLLLATDDASGKTRNRGGSLDYALAGAVLSDLELLGRVLLTSGKGPRHGRNRVVVEGSSPTGDPLLDAAVASLKTRDRRPASAVRSVKKGLRRKLYQRLVDAGVLRLEHRRLLGLFPATRHPAINRTPAAESRAAINRDFLGGSGHDPRTSALIACLAVCGRVSEVVPEVHPMLTKAEIRRRARAHLKGHWPARAAQSAYQTDASAASG